MSSLISLHNSAMFYLKAGSCSHVLNKVSYVLCTTSKGLYMCLHVKPFIAYSISNLY